MDFLVIGSGAREHALANKFKKSAHVRNVYVWPGNALIARSFEILNVSKHASWAQLCDAAKHARIDAIVVGPELPLQEGLADEGARAGIPVFGPNKIAAQLETSKAFAKHIMSQAGIRTAAYEIVHSESECQKRALWRLENRGGVVIKASGLAAGKGVFVCFRKEQIPEALSHLFGSMREASRVIVLEDILTGREVSAFFTIGQKSAKFLGFAVDYKRLLDGNEGPNTGGMGCYSPVPWLPHDAQEIVEREIVNPLLRQLKREDIHYQGFLYVGLMWTSGGPYVVEFNVRLGDPETQVLCETQQDDWGAMVCEQLGLPYSALPGRASRWKDERKAVAVVLASKGYPFGHVSNHAADQEKINISATRATEGVQAFGAAIENDPKNPQNLFAKSGRVLTFVGSGATFAEARSHVYERITNEPSLQRLQYRRDIGP